MSLFPSFFVCPICGSEFVRRMQKGKTECPHCDFAGSKDHFIITGTKELRIPHHPLRMRRGKKTVWMDFFFLGFPTRNGNKASV